MVSQNITKQFNHNTRFLFIGPTASGKTALVHWLCDELLKDNIICEVVNLDAFQIYKGLDIGTAKVTPKEQTQYHYHGLNLVCANENLDANTFASKISHDCQQIIDKGHIPICVGGSGLYLRAFLHGLDNLPERDPKIRAKIKTVAEEKGWPACHTWLSQVDPDRASELHPNDKTRIERALEIYMLTGKPMSTLQSKKGSLNNQSVHFPNFVVHMELEDIFLKEKIKARVPTLIAQGWIEEVQKLSNEFGPDLENFHSMKAIGYKDILRYIKSNKSTSSISADFKILCEQIATRTWQYAKRQGTWNAKEKKDFVIHKNSKEEFCNLYKQIKEIINK